MHKISDSVKNSAAVAKEKSDILQAKAAEKAEKATARTKEEKQLAEERELIKENEARMKLHETKAEILEGKLERKYHHHQPIHSHDKKHAPAGTTVDPVTGLPTTTPYPRT